MLCSIKFQSSSKLAKMQSKTVFISLKPYLLLMRVFGFIPVDRSNGTVKISSKLQIYFIVHFLLMQCIPITLCYFMMSSFYEKGPNEIIVAADTLWRIVAISVCLTVIVQSFIQLFNCRKINRIVEIIDEFDVKAQKLGMIANYVVPRSKISQSIVLVAVALIYSAISISFLISQESDIELRKYTKLPVPVSVRTNTCLQYGLLIGCLLIIQFMAFSGLIKKRFLDLSEFVTRQRIKARLIYELFSDLCDATSEVNRVLTFNLNFTLLFLLLNVVFCIFSTLTHLSSPELLEFKSKSAHWLSNFSWIFGNSLLIVIICHAGDSLTSAANLTEDTVLKLIYQWNDEFYNNELRCVLFQMKSRNKRVENVFIVIGWKLLFVVSKISDRQPVINN